MKENIRELETNVPDSSKKTIFLIIGRSCVGKSTLVNLICTAMGLKQVRSYTTRPIRENENPETSDHIFIKPEDIPKYKDDMVAYTSINGYEYFVTSEILEQSDVYVIDPNGVRDLIRRTGNRYNLVKIYVTTPFKSALKRSLERGDKNFEERRISENSQFEDYERSESWDYLIENDGDLFCASSKLAYIIGYSLGYWKPISK